MKKYTNGGTVIWVAAVVCAILVLAIFATSGDCDHEYGSWTVTQEPTSTEEGVQIRVCQKCGDTETQKLAALGGSEDTNNLNHVIFGGAVSPVLTWEYGGIGHTGQGGSYLPATAEIRSRGFIKLPEGATVRTKGDDVEYKIHFFKEADVTTHIGSDSVSADYRKTVWTMDAAHAGYFCVIQMRKANGGEIPNAAEVFEKLVIENADTTTPGLVTRVEDVEKEVEIIKSGTDIIMEAAAEQMVDGDVLTVAQRYDIKKNCVQEFYADITVFDSVTVGHGWTKYMGSYVTVTDTDVTMYFYGANGELVVQKTEAHGLNISGFIHIILKNDDACNLEATIITAGGTYTFVSAGYYACNGDVFATTTSMLKNCVCKWIAKDLALDIFLFGDSYISLGDPSKFATQLVNMGFADNMLMSGYGGATSRASLVSFKNIVALKKPKYVVWALGMNDGDTATKINANWKACYEEVADWCAENGAELILVTVPNTPTITNTHKNAFIRASGHRYIDFAKAVGAEEAGSAWYSGMLSGDNVHSTELGAKILASRFLLDFPECI